MEFLKKVSGLMTVGVYRNFHGIGGWGWGGLFDELCKGHLRQQLFSQFARNVVIIRAFIISW